MQVVDTFLRSNGTLIGRLLMGFLFVFSGGGMLLDGVNGVSGMIESRGLPMAMILAWIVVVWKIGAGGALMLGYKTRMAALALIVFTVLVTLLYHMSAQDVNLLKNLAIIGGLLYVYVYGPGNGWRLRAGESSPSGSSMAL